MSVSAPRLALLSCLLMPLPNLAAQELGEIIGDDVYVNCEYHLAVHFPEEPMFRDLEYRDGERAVSARQFYTEGDGSLLGVTVAHFEGGPERDWAIVERAVETLQSRGETLFDMRVWYDQPNLDGRQLRIELDDGRLLRASVYMVDYRLYIMEAVSDANDFDAILFSESISLIDENGTDYEGNPTNLSTSAPGTSAGLPPRQYDCSRLYR
jgi:hypothetical protein